jgi:hypothetical protein
MSLIPEMRPSGESPAVSREVRRTASGRWSGMLVALLAVVVGLFLTIAPWEDSWSFNYVQELNPSLEYLWEDPAFRSAISGLGVANLLIALLEVRRAWSRFRK